MAYAYFHCREGDIPLHNRDVRKSHAYINDSGTEGGVPPTLIEEHDRIVRSWCAHFCRVGEAHVLETNESGRAVQLYKHVRFERKRTCCAAYKMSLVKST